MADNPSSAEIISQTNRDSRQYHAPAAESTSPTASTQEPTGGKRENATAPANDEKRDGKEPDRKWVDDLQDALKRVPGSQYGAIYWAALITVILACSESDPWGTWGAIIVGVIALVLAVHIAGRVLPSQYFWGGLVVFAVLVYVISLAYQAGAPARALRHQNNTNIRIAVNSTPVTLAISYPEQAPLEKPDQSGLPLFVYIQGATATPTSTPTPTLTATATSTLSVSSGPPGALTNASASTSTATATATPTPTPTATATATSAAVITATGRISFTLAFLPQSEGLVFSDQQGGPVVPQIVVQGGDEAPPSAALYVRRSSANTDASPVNVSMALRTNNQIANWQPLGGIAISPESTYAAWWRDFWGLLLGPATPILALVGTLLGFGWQWWQGEQKRRKDEQDREETARNEISSLLERVSSQLDQLAQLESELDKLRDKYRPVQALQDDFERADQSLRSAWQEFITTINQLPEPHQWFEARDKLGMAQNKCPQWRNLDEEFKKADKVIIHAAIAYATDLTVSGSSQDRTKAWEVYDKLEKARQQQPWTGTDLELELGTLGAAVRSLPLTWPMLQQADPATRSVPAIAAWIEQKKDELDLDQDPFGPDDAEKETLLLEFVVEPPGWSAIQSAEPTVILGAPGSGRTAARLWLTQICRDARHCFPVHLDLRLDGSLGDDESLQAQVTRATFDGLVGYFARNPHEAENTPFEQRRAIGRLYRLHQDEVGELSHCLVGAGLQDPSVGGVLADRLLQGLGPSPPSGSSKRANILDILGDAKPGTRRQVYLLVELADLTAKRLTPDEAGTALEPLLQIMAPLASREVNIKLFLPAYLKPYLGAWLARVQSVDLHWDTDALRAMLENRMISLSGNRDFKLLFRRLPDGADPTDVLVAETLKSKGVPRRLVKLGREILLEHIRQRPDRPYLVWDDLQGAFERLRDGEEQ